MRTHIRPIFVKRGLSDAAQDRWEIGYAPDQRQGLFHALTWLMSVSGLALLWRAGRREDVPWVGKTFVGALFLGWGLFNFIEGVIDHQILGVHHVHPGNSELAWDLGFLASGLLMIALGSLLIRAGRRLY